MNSVLTYTLYMMRIGPTHRILASGIAAFLAVGSLEEAFAADLARAPAAAAPVPTPVPVVPVYNWTGFYIGFNAGGSIGSDSNSNAISVFPTVVINNPVVSSDGRRALPGGIAGGQIGYNWQLGPSWVFGVEGDWQWSGQRNTSNLIGQDFGPPMITASYSDEEKINSIATARARFGWARDSFLWYVTGGGAWAGMKDDYTLTSSVPPVTFPSPTGINFSTTKSGWTIGGGVETHLGGNWTAKVEYLFVDLGSVANTFTAPLTTVGTSVVFNSSHSVQDHIIRIGVNYKFW
jgi:outer membrane immunogenic protein